ncbi:MAG: SDR family NAD(P)-dependent oxidoreductase [Deltaproteobacteria bacterium]
MTKMKVLVTGVGGYIGTHVARELLERGHTVRGTVRDPSDAKKNGHLAKIGDIELFAADLTTPKSFDEAMTGCDAVMHAASVVKFSAKDAQKEIVDVAVEGTRNVIDSVIRADNVQRVVQTSSIAAVVDMEHDDDYVHTEEDWCASATVQSDPYALSKTLAEKKAREMCDALPDGERFTLAAANPAFVLGPVYGPVHLRSSPTVIEDLYTGKFPLAPNLSFSIVDVRDVALAHALLLEADDPAPRTILSNGVLWMRELAAALRERFPDCKAPKRGMPNALMYAVGLFDKRIEFPFLRDNLDRARTVDGSFATKSLGFTYRDIRTAAQDTAASMVELGFV